MWGSPRNQYAVQPVDRADTHHGAPHQPGRVSLPGVEEQAEAYRDGTQIAWGDTADDDGG